MSLFYIAMKHPLASAFTLCLIVIAHLSNAQCPSNKGQLEIAAGYGLVGSHNVTDAFSPEKSTNPDTRKENGTPFANVRYFVYNRLALGVFAGAATETGQLHDYFASAAVTYKKSYTTIALEIYYIYTFRKMFEVYTLAGIGQSFIATETTRANSSVAPGGTTKTNETKIKAQYTPVGVRYGGRLGIFAELGLGYKGIFSGGISYKFGSPCWWKQ